MTKRYLRVTWHHDLCDEPTVLLSETDAGIETRKVEIYADGHMDYAGESMATGATRLSETLMPAAEEIAAQPEFTPEEIDEARFERAWRAATGNAELT